MYIEVHEEKVGERSPITLADAIINYCRDTYDADYYDLVACEIAEHIQVHFRYRSLEGSRLRGERYEQ